MQRPLSALSLDKYGSSEPSMAFQDHPSSLLGQSSINIDSETRTHVLRLDGDETNDDGGSKKRLVVVRYFLDRPGYGLHNSAARLWFHPPLQVTPADVFGFLVRQEIAQPNLLIEVYLDKYQSFMLLDACKHALVVWDFASADFENPGILNVRLTDLSQAQLDLASAPPEQNQHIVQQANTSPTGLFSFSIMVGLESTALIGNMFGESAISPLFTLSWGPFMVFMGGVLQCIVATLQVFRNNIYGATAFYGFGTFWLAAGTNQILQLYFATPGTEAHSILAVATESNDMDPVGRFVRTMFMLSFVVALWIQTFCMNRLSTILIFLLGLKMLFGSLTGFTETSMQYAQLVTGYLTSIFAFFVFLVEFTNSVYDREVFRTYKWNEMHSPEEVFGAAGKVGTLRSQATKLRQAKYSSQRDPRAAMSTSQKGDTLSETNPKAFKHE